MSLERDLLGCCSATQLALLALHHFPEFNQETINCVNFHAQSSGIESSREIQDTEVVDVAFLTQWPKSLDASIVKDAKVWHKFFSNVSNTLRLSESSHLRSGRLGICVPVFHNDMKKIKAFMDEISNIAHDYGLEPASERLFSKKDLQEDILLEVSSSSSKATTKAKTKPPPFFLLSFVKVF